MRVVALAVAAAAVAAGVGAFIYFEPLPTIGHGDERADDVFTDCELCPEMLPIETGEFVMGQQPRRRERLLAWAGLSDEPRRVVAIEQPYAIGRTEVTFAQWDACVADGGCGGYSPSDHGWGRGARPVIEVSWDDAQSYLRWLSAKTGRSYRLPSEAEWEYAARAGTRTPYPWGRRPSYNQANFGGEECPPCEGETAGEDDWMHTAPVASFPPNRFGVYDTSGNVYEWVEDCLTWPEPDDVASAKAVRVDGCASHVMRGGGWHSDPRRVSTFYRAYNPPNHRGDRIGFRVARALSENEGSVSPESGAETEEATDYTG
jgi:formylglycine-generating enzyme required for sulfatase activity